MNRFIIALLFCLWTLPAFSQTSGAIDGSARGVAHALWKECAPGQGLVKDTTAVYGVACSDGGGGNPFDQDLNTTDGVQFAAVNGRRYVSIPITNAQMLTLPTMPIELLPAPGEGLIIVLAGDLFWNFDTTDTALGNWTAGSEWIEAQVRLGTVGSNQYGQVFYRNSVYRNINTVPQFNLIDDDAPDEVADATNQPLTLQVDPDAGQAENYTGGSNDNIYQINFSYYIMNATTGAVVLP